MKLRISYKPADAASMNVQVTADATATASDVARALAKGPAGDVTLPDDAQLTLQVTDSMGRPAPLPATQTVINSGLMSGSLVEVRRAARRVADRGEAVALLRVIDGPDAGIEVPLPMGTSTLGRAHECDVRLSDPLVSKVHARIEIRDGVDFVDTNSANGVVVGGVRVPRIAVGPGDVVQLGDSLVTVAYSRRPAEAAASSTDIAFVRSPRVLARRALTKVKLPQPPSESEGMRFPWVMMLMPLVMGAVMFMATQNPMSGLFILFSPLFMIASWADQRSNAKRQAKKGARVFADELDQVDVRLGALHDLQRRQLLAAHPAVAECVDHIGRLGELLWSRRPEHPEFLQVRLGLGAVPPLVEYENDDSPGQSKYTQPRAALLDKWAKIIEAPVITDLKSVGGVGIAGTSGLAEGVARAVLAQLVALHAPTELVITVLTSTVGRSRWQWAEWLPHAASPQSPVGALQLASDAANGRQLLDNLESLVAARTGKDGPPSMRGPLGEERKAPPAPPLPAVIVVVDEPLVDVGRLTRLAERGPDAGVYVLWVASDRRLLPAACRTYLDLADASVPTAGMVRTGELSAPVACESLDTETASRVSRRLAPVIDVGTPTTDESDVPRMVSVVTLLGAEDAVEPEQILTRWRENGSWVDRSAPAHPRERAGDLRAIVGHTGTDPFTLDLRTQGPHALVGGTTGSGKSEFLQAWVLGLAHSYSPDRVTFLFVDYKGGAAFARCTELPHNVGMVTDLSPHLVRRALRSLRAEIHHRETLLQEKGVKDLIDFELTGDPNCPPSLIIVVDEFAALKSEVPAFYDGVVDVAQRGRSLGLHLIMATQRPAGVITDSLRANTNLRVALRMNDDHDSTDVLGDTMAARFDPSIPGRGAARTGPGRITRFQAGFPGARTYAEPAAPPISVTELDFGLGRPWKVATETQAGPKPDKDIERVVAAVKKASGLGAVPTPRRPWLDPLAAIYNLEHLSQRTDAELVLGVMDDPDHQRQIVAHYRPDEFGNILYAGTGGSGKTSALRTLAIAAGITPRGGPVHVYGLDFGGGGLGMLEDLPYVGSIVSGDDEERVTRLMRYLSALIEERAGRYSALRASSLPEYRRQSGTPDEPRILVLLDNFGAFRTEYDTTMARLVTYDAFRRIIADGRAVGVHVAMTVDRLPTVPTALGASFQQRVILRLTNEDGYNEAAVPRDVLTPNSPPGRSMLQDQPEELQLAILGDDPSPLAQSRLIEQLASEIAPFVKQRPEPIRALPTLVSPRQLPAELGGLPVLGLESQSLAPLGFDPRGPLMVAGPRQSGRTSALRWFAESLRRWSPRTELYLLAGRRSPLASWPGWAGVQTGAGDVDNFLRDVLMRNLETDGDPEGKPRFAVFVEGLPDFANGLAEMALTDALVAARRNSHPFFTEGEITEVAGYGGLMTEARQARTGFILQPETADEGLFRTPLGRCNRNDFPPGRGLWVKGGKTARVQLPLVE